MSGREQEDGRPATLRLVGELDLTTVTSYESRIERAAQASDDCLVVDLSELRFIDTAGVAMLFRKARKLAEEERQLVYVASPGSLARRVLAIAHLPLQESLREAYRALRPWLESRRTAH